MSLKEDMKKDFDNIFLNTDEFAETFDVIRNGSILYQITGIFANTTVLHVKSESDILIGDILRSKDTSRHVTVQRTEKTSSCLIVYCQ